MADASKDVPATEDLPPELEFLRLPALDFVGQDRQIVSCGQADYGRLERALRNEVAGLTKAESTRRQDTQRTQLRSWLSQHRESEAPLVIGLRFVEMLLSAGG